MRNMLKNKGRMFRVDRYLDKNTSNFLDRLYVKILVLYLLINNIL